jgi:hypothetical protein
MKRYSSNASQEQGSQVEKKIRIPDATDLFITRGYQVIKLFSKEEVNAYNIGLNALLKVMPEYKKGMCNIMHVMGGFGGLGNASSFHAPIVRTIRSDIQEAMRPHLESITQRLGMGAYRQLVDRLCFRRPGIKPGAEAWHRDMPEKGFADFLLAHVLGGWLSLQETQSFVCCPGTHNDQHTGSGFAAIPKTEHKALKAASVNVLIPPGCIIIFYEDIIHCVRTKSYKKPMMRLFVGWAITNEQEDISKLLSLLHQQAVVPLKSGQVPPMYAKLHWCNWLDKLKTFSTQLVDECLIDRYRLTGIDRGYHRVAKRVFPSLQQLNCKYNNYSNDDINVLSSQIL